MRIIARNGKWKLLLVVDGHQVFLDFNPEDKERIEKFIQDEGFEEDSDDPSLLESSRNEENSDDEDQTPNAEPEGEMITKKSTLFESFNEEWK